MAKRNKKNLWRIIPSRDPGDQLYNRRLISYFSLAYSAFWFQQVLLMIIIGMVLNSPLDAATVGALLGVPASLAGLGFYKYLQAASKSEDETDDQKKEKPE